MSVDNPCVGNTPPLDLSLASPVDIVDWSRWYSLTAEDNIDFGGGVHAVSGRGRTGPARSIRHRGSRRTLSLHITARRRGVGGRNGHVLFGQFQRGLSSNNGATPTAPHSILRSGGSSRSATSFNLPDRRFTSTLAAFDLVKTNRGDFTFFPVIRTIGKARSRGSTRFQRRGHAEALVIGSYAYTETKVDTGRFCRQYARARRQPVGTLPGCRQRADRRWCLLTSPHGLVTWATRSRCQAMSASTQRLPTASVWLARK